MVLQQSTVVDYCVVLSYSFMVLLSTCQFSAVWNCKKK